MPASDPWKHRKSVRICACLDMVFAIVVVSAYVLRVVMENTDEDTTSRNPRGFFKPGEKPAITAFFWFAAFFINVVQLSVAYLLFSVVKKGMTDQECSIQISRSKYWLILANVIFVMLISKFIFFVFFDKANNSADRIIMVILCIAELFFKAYAMYFAKEFIDDLKASLNLGPSKMQFVTIVGGGIRQTEIRTSV